MILSFTGSTLLSDIVTSFFVTNQFERLRGLACERTLPTGRPPLNGEVSANFCGCHVICVTDTYGRFLAFLEPSRYFLLQVAPQLNS
jgi:hypothetical protein